MIIGPIVDSGVAASRDHVDVSITVRLHKADYVDGKSQGRKVDAQEWAALKATMAAVVAKGNTATITAMEPAADDGGEPPVSSALLRYMERDADTDAGESGVDATSDTDSDGWDLSDAGSDGREDE